MSFGRSAGESEDGVDVCLEMSAAVPANSLVDIDVVADTVIRLVVPPLDIGE